MIAARATAASLVIIASMLITSRAAATPSAKLVYVRGAGADSCPAEPELRRAVALRLGYDPFFPTAPKTVVAEVTSNGTEKRGFRGVVQIVGDDGKLRGRRELSSSGEDCGELVTALALAVSLALDDLEDAPVGTPTAVATATVAEEPKTEEVAAPPPPIAEEPLERDRTAPAPKEGLAVQIGVGPTLSLGTAPGVAFGAGGFGAIRSGIASLRIDLRGDLPSSEAFAPAGSVSTNALVGGLSACLHATIPFVCAGAAGGWVWSRTEGIAHPATDGAAIGILLARAGIDLPIGRTVTVSPFVEGGLDLARPRVTVDGRDVYRASLAVMTTGVQIGAIFR